MEYLNQSALAIDFTMLLLLLLVQVIIYPAFQFIQELHFRSWHEAYCRKITFFVMPVMTVQFVEASFLLVQHFHLLTGLKFSGVLAAWYLTFSIFVPLHNQLRLGWSLHLIEKLIHWNWIRTFTWGMVFLLSCILRFAEFSPIAQ